MFLPSQYRRLNFNPHQCHSNYPTMNRSTLQNVKNNLSAKYYATNDTWLKDCVEYYLSEHKTPDDLEVLEFAISQWQLSDLREISNEKPCLPKNLAQQKCVTLRGHFVLQVEKVYDIGESKYKQLERLRDVSTENIRATEAEATQAREPKKKRMLYLHLTDGAQNVTAIEHKPIRFLKDQLLPGFKLMIRGPVTCRRGVIMLDETNVSEIGGEVETLLIPNAQENVLARALNLPENPDPYNDNVKSNPTEDVLFDDDFDVDMDAVELIEKRSQEESAKTSHFRSTNENSINAKFSSDATSNFRSTNENSINAKFSSDATSNFRSTNENSMNAKFSSDATSNFRSTNENSMNAKFSSDATSNTPFPRKIESANDSLPASLIHETESDLLFEMIDENEFENLPTVVSQPKTPLKPKCKTPIRVLPKESEFPDDDDDLILTTDDSIFSATENWQKADVKSNCRVGDISKLRIDANVKHVAAPSPKKIVPVASKIPTQAGIKRTASVLSPPVLKPSAEKIRCSKPTPKKTSVRKITDFMKKDDRTDDSTLRVPKICDTVSELLIANDTQNFGRKTVRGNLGKFDKLSRNGERWEFNATIMDGTGSIDAAFSSEILEKMLGFSVAEFKMQKKLKKNNPEIEHRLRQGFRSAENKLKNLDALLDIELAPGQKPKVVQIRDMTDEQRQILDKTAKNRCAT